MRWTVYILRCADGKYYVGCTSDLIKRRRAHDKGRVSSTRSKLPVEVIVTIYFGDRHRAYQFEKYLKSGLGKSERLALCFIRVSRYALILKYLSTLVLHTFPCPSHPLVIRRYSTARDRSAIRRSYFLFRIECFHLHST